MPQASEMSQDYCWVLQGINYLNWKDKSRTKHHPYFIRCRELKEDIF